MVSITWIISFSLFLLSFFGIVSTAIVFSKPIDEYKFSFLRIFPFEIIRTSEKNAKFYTFSTYLFSGMCFSPLILINKTSRLSYINPLTILIVCLFGLAGICFLFLNVFDVTHVKPHISLFTVLSFLTLLSGSLVTARSFTAYSIFLKHGSKEFLFLLCGILSGIISLFSLCLIVNPKLKFWAKLDKVDDKYVRPKKFPLAYSEWGMLLSLFLLESVFFVELLIK